MKWPFKDPDEVLDYSVDWSRYLEDKTIVTVSWYCDDADGVKTSFDPVTTVNGLTSGAASKTSTVATIRISAGTNGLTYRITCAITDSSGQISERKISLQVRER